MYQFKTYIWFETFKYNWAPSQLNNKKGGEFYELKRSRYKTEIGKKII